MRTLPIILAVGAVLSGCMMGPNYQRPSVDTPATFRFDDPHAADTANTEWWKQFGDPVLDDLIAEALANNKSVRIAAANIEQAAGVLTTTRAPLFPQVGYRGNAARHRLSTQGSSPVAGSNPQSSFELLGGASWEIDLWGRIRRLTESARASFFASVEARRGVILSLVSSVASSYIQLRGLDAQLEVARRTLATYAEAVKLFSLQFKHGQVSEMTVAQARTQYATALATIPQLESQIAQLEQALSILLGRNPGPITRGTTIDALPLVAVPAGVPSQLLNRRPDLAQAEQNLVAANAQIGAAKALYFPTISLTGTAGLMSGELHDLFQGPARTWRYAGSFTGPIFTAGAISGQVAQAEAAQQAALVSYEAAIQAAFADVANALVAHQKLSEQLEAQRELVTAARDYTRLANLQYTGGYTPYFTVLQAEQQLFPAELNEAQTRAALLSSLVTVYQAMGGGWVTEADKLTGAPDIGTDRTPLIPFP
jgi:multidrug efflux system outer membrane protein